MRKMLSVKSVSYLLSVVVIFGVIILFTGCKHLKFNEDLQIRMLSFSLSFLLLLLILFESKEYKLIVD